MIDFSDCKNNQRNQIIAIFLILMCPPPHAIAVAPENYPLIPFDQNLNNYLSLKDQNYFVSLLKFDCQKLQEFYAVENRFYPYALLPSSKKLEESVLLVVKKKENQTWHSYDNKNDFLAPQYRQNFKKHSDSKIKSNPDFDFLGTVAFKQKNNAGVVNKMTTTGGYQTSFDSATKRPLDKCFPSQGTGPTNLHQRCKVRYYHRPKNLYERYHKDYLIHNTTKMDHFPLN